VDVEHLVRVRVRVRVRVGVRVRVRVRVRKQWMLNTELGGVCTYCTCSPCSCCRGVRVASQ